VSHFRIHDDGLARCSWVTNDPIYIDYHDREWGTPGRGQQALFEAICLEGFQAGLSWLTILRRREGFRRAFFGFDIEKVATLDANDVERLMQDEGIIRNRAKILSAINNANVILEKKLDLTSLIWSFAPEQPVTPEEGFEWRATSKESDGLSKALKGLGFSFVGSTTMYALMQSSGLVQDHAPGCFRRA
jgi:DNA-3-methyladenine glycosylase I